MEETEEITKVPRPPKASRPKMEDVELFPCGCDARSRHMIGKGRMVILKDKTRVCPCGIVWGLAWRRVGGIVRDE